jgi:hypothetical protein
MINIVTDSSADIPKELLQKYNIWVVPLSIQVNGKEFTEGVDITPQEFYREILAAGAELNWNISVKNGIIDQETQVLQAAEQRNIFGF